jgi:hypothetical protein
VEILYLGRTPKPSYPHLSHTKEIVKETQRVKLGSIEVVFFVLFFFISLVIVKSSGLGGSSYQVAGEVWGFSSLPDYRLLLIYFHDPAAPHHWSVREGGCPSQRLLHMLPFSLYSRPFLSTPEPSCCAEELG